MRVLQIVLYGIIARYLGPEGFGKYYYIYNFVLIFEVLSDFGLRIIAVREVAKDRDRSREHFGNIIVLKGFFLFPILVISGFLCLLHDSLGGFLGAGFARHLNHY